MCYLYGVYNMRINQNKFIGGEMIKGSKKKKMSNIDKPEGNIVRDENGIAKPRKFVRQAHFAIGCPYVYTGNESAVQNNLKKVGDVCGSTKKALIHRYKTVEECGIDNANHYCFSHARKLGYIKEEALEEINNGIEVRGVLKQIGLKQKDNQWFFNEEACFDLSNEFFVLSSLYRDNNQRNVDYAIEKHCLAQWTAAGFQVRFPEKLSEVAKILGVDELTLRKWLRSPMINSLIKQEIDMKTDRAAGLVAMKLLNELKGSSGKDLLNAIELWGKLFGKNAVRQEVKTEQGGIDERLLAEARSRAAEEDFIGVKDNGKGENINDLVDNQLLKTI